MSVYMSQRETHLLTCLVQQTVSGGCRSHGTCSSTHDLMQPTLFQLLPYISLVGYSSSDDTGVAS